MSGGQIDRNMDMNSTILLLLLLLFCQGRRFRQQFQLKPDSCHPAKKVLILPEYTWSFPNACWKMCYCLMNPRFCQGLGHNFKKYVWQKHNADVEKSTIPQSEAWWRQHYVLGLFWFAFVFFQLELALLTRWRKS